MNKGENEKTNKCIACGELPKLHRHEEQYQYRCGNEDCYMQSSREDTDEKALEVWNKRNGYQGMNPCMQCGTGTIPRLHMHENMYKVECMVDTCNNRTAYHPTPEMAIGVWNKLNDPFDDDTLKPCPECGGVGVRVISNSLPGNIAYSIECSICGYEIPAQDNKHEAERIWNGEIKLPGAKDKAGKVRLSLVPMNAIRAVADIREYGISKYGKAEDWPTVEKMDWLDAAYRHLGAMLEKGLDSRDDESGKLHAAHMACDAMLLLSCILGGEECR